MGTGKLALSDRMIELVASRFRTLGEPQRLRILQAIESGEKTVNEITDALQGNQSNVSRHLGVLTESGLVHRRPDGVKVYYSIADPMVFRLCGLVCRSASPRRRTPAATPRPRR